VEPEHVRLRGGGRVSHFYSPGPGGGTGLNQSEPGGLPGVNQSAHTSVTSLQNNMSALTFESWYSSFRLNIRPSYDNYTQQ
jgi:hypothetical protein